MNRKQWEEYLTKPDVTKEEKETAVIHSSHWETCAVGALLFGPKAEHFFKVTPVEREQLQNIVRGNNDFLLDRGGEFEVLVERGMRKEAYQVLLEIFGEKYE